MNDPEMADTDLDVARTALEAAIKILDRLRATPRLLPAVRAQAAPIRHVADAAYVAVRNIEWLDGIPSDATAEWASKRAAERKASP